MPLSSTQRTKIQQTIELFANTDHCPWVDIDNSVYNRTLMMDYSIEISNEISIGLSHDVQATVTETIPDTDPPETLSHEVILKAQDYELTVTISIVGGTDDLTRDAYELANKLMLKLKGQKAKAELKTVNVATKDFGLITKTNEAYEQDVFVRITIPWVLNVLYIEEPDVEDAIDYFTHVGYDDTITVPKCLIDPSQVS
jgi:hypothetical protein